MIRLYDLLITGAHIVTVNRGFDVIYPGVVAIDGDGIAAVGKVSDFDGAEARRVIDASGKAVFPGLVNTHTHLFQNLLKGLGDDRVLSDWLLAATLPSAVRLGPLEVYTAASLGCLDALHSGTTTILDYAYAHPVPGLGDEAVRAFREVGIRAVLARGAHDAGEQFGAPPALTEHLDSAVADFERLYSAYHGAGNGRLQVWLAPGAVWNNTEAMLRGMYRAATEHETGLTVHISETMWDRESSEKTHGGLNDFAALEAYGILGPNVLMVHCVYLTPAEIAVAKAHDVKISINTVSNMYLASGIAPVPAMLKAGLTCGLGTDGAASNNTQDMIEMLKSTALLHKVATKDPTAITARTVLEMATIEGARVLGLEGKIGSLEPGKKADLFIFDPARAARAVPLFDPVSTLVYAGGSGNVETVLVDGRVVLEDGRVLGLDERAALEKAQRVAEDLAERAGTFRRDRNGR